MYRRCRRNRDAAALHCATLFDAPQTALLLSLSGVVFGVAIFICTQAQTQGFARHFIDSTIGSNGALVIKSRFRPRYEPLMVSSEEFKRESAPTPLLRGDYGCERNHAGQPAIFQRRLLFTGPAWHLSARAGFENATVELYGIEPALHAQTTDLRHQLVEGSFDDFRNNTSSIIVGSKLAELLQAGIGDTVQLLSPNGEYWRFTVAAIARAGVGSIDATRVYSHARIAQTLLQRPFGASHESSTNCAIQTARRLSPAISKRCFSTGIAAGRNARRARCNFF